MAAQNPYPAAGLGFVTCRWPPHAARPSRLGQRRRRLRHRERCAQEGTRRNGEADMRVRELLEAVHEGERSTKGAAEDDLRRREVAVGVRRVSQLQHSTQEAVLIKAARRAGVGHQEALSRLNRNFRPPIDRGKLTEDTRVARLEFRTTIARELLRYAEGGEERTEVLDQASRARQGSTLRAQDLYPAREPIPDN
ncbi:hypothetical protein NQZ68_000834 [Dissostichus eleginoides]|nr:hypothetical protein NQZ68_000834 [Dissostichus eleginoides]